MTSTKSRSWVNSVFWFEVRALDCDDHRLHSDIAEVWVTGSNMCQRPRLVQLYKNTGVGGLAAQKGIGIGAFVDTEREHIIIYVIASIHQHLCFCRDYRQATGVCS